MSKSVTMRLSQFRVGDVLTSEAGDRFVVTSDKDWMKQDDHRYTFTSVPEWIAYQQEQMRVAAANIDMVQPR
jgi:hypothetical protein